jgi:ElaB/YqjD/DUF883 family membrane-anchored ribosome-binding protein
MLVAVAARAWSARRSRLIDFVAFSYAEPATTSVENAFEGKLMSNATDADIQALIAELKVLRADITKIAEIVKDTARHGSEEAAERIRETAERGWEEARTRAAGLMDEMEERPVQSAMVIFGVGVLLGLLVGRR